MRLDRRSWIRATAATATTAAAGHVWGDASPTVDSLQTFVPTRAITSGPRHHWFGYYDKREFDPSGRRVLAAAVQFEGRSPTADDSIEVGYVDTAAADRWVKLGVSNAWGWQQGCMLQWVGRDGRRVLWNDRQDDRFVCRLHDISDGNTVTLPQPIYTIDQEGSFGLSTDFRRIQNLRPGYGYSGLPDPYVRQQAPEGSGIQSVDLRTGKTKMILSLADVARIPWPDGETHQDAWHYFNHLLINPSGTRFIVLHRYRPRFDPDTLTFEGNFVTRMLTANIDGTDLCVLDPSGHTSHFIWKDDRTITMWTRPAGRPWGFYDFVDQTDRVTPVGADKMTENGHNTYLSGRYGDWILNDTYPDRVHRRQTVYLYHVPSGRRIDLGHFPSPPQYTDSWRCDTHPRCSVDGRTVAIDSPHAGGRQVYLLDIGDVLDAA